jgi:hypothetical protein
MKKWQKRMLWTAFIVADAGALAEGGAKIREMIHDKHARIKITCTAEDGSSRTLTAKGLMTDDPAAADVTLQRSDGTAYGFSFGDTADLARAAQMQEKDDCRVSDLRRCPLDFCPSFL